MRCEDINKLLTAYLDEQVTPEERNQIEAHLASCEKCREELRLLATTRERLRQALIARAAGIEPSPQAWDVVRQRITVKNSFWEQFSGIINRPLWRAAIPVVLVIVMAVAVLQGSGKLLQLGSMKSAPPPAPAPAITSPDMPVPMPTPAPGPTRGIRLERVPDVVITYGEKVEISLSFTNEASKPLTINPFPPEIKIIELPDVKPPGIIVQAFPVGSGERVLQPGESVSHTVDWDQKNNGGEQVPPGWYSVEVTLATSRGSATRVLVLPPEGVMEETIEVNQSETVNNITITLERVELTATGMKVYAFNTPPSYNLPQGPMLPPPMFMIHAEAEYTVDVGVRKQTFPSAIRFLENGVLHTWGEYLDPVPSDAKELTFRITKLGDWLGPWEFRIPLQ